MSGGNSVGTGSVQVVDGATPYTTKGDDTIKGGAQLQVRRARPSERTQIMKAIDYRSESTASSVELAQVLVQWGVVAAEGLVDEKGNEVKFRTAPRPLLGKIAVDAVYDALASVDVGKIAAHVMGQDSLSEEQQGN